MCRRANVPSRNKIYAMFLLISVILLLLYLLWKWHTNRILSGLKSLNGPKSIPFLGGLLEVLPASETLWRMGDLVDKYGKTYKMAISYAAGIATVDPEFIEFIVTSQETLNKSILYTFLAEWLGDGLLLSSSNKWRSRRKMLTPSFHFKILEEFLHVFNKNNEILTKQLQETIKQKGNTIDISHYITLAAMDNIVETAMGTSVNSQLDDQSDYVLATKYMTSNMYNHMVNPFKFFKATDIFTPGYWKERKALKILKKFTMDLIKTKREAYNNKVIDNNDNNDNSEDSFGIKKKTAFLDLLLQVTIDGKPLSDDDIREEVDTFMFEGHDTVSAGISFALFCIAKYPGIQAKILEEQRDIFGNEPNREVTSNDLKQMNYLELVIKESLRFFPSVPGIGRHVSKDFQYKDLYVRKGTTIVVVIHKVHMDPEIYPNPEEFIPERFLPEEQAKRNPFAYLPFSAGHRNCIGQKFAMMELKTTISKVCRDFILSQTQPEHKLDLPSAIVLYSANGIKIDLKPRVW